MKAIRTHRLTKRFGDVVAVADLDLEVETGEIYGIVGPNGAGKSTTIAILLDLLRPSSGSARVLGYDTQTNQLPIRRRVGVLPEGSALFGRLTGREHLQFAIDANDSGEDPEALFDRVGLDEARAKPTRTYSTGMAQRLRLGLALVGSPQLLILDEPASGLDPTGVTRLREIVRAESERGAAVFFSSHSLDHVRAVCDRVGVLVDGSLRAIDTIDTLDGARPRLVLSGVDDTHALARSLAGMPAVDAVDRLNRGLGVTLADPAAKPAVVERARSVTRVQDVSLERGSLEREFERLAEVDR